MPGPSGRNIMKIFERKPSQTKAEKMGKLSDVIGEMLEMVSRQNIDIGDFDHKMPAPKKSSMNMIESPSRNLPVDTGAVTIHRSKSDRKKVRQQRKTTFKLLDFLKTGDPRDRINPRDNPDTDQSGSGKSLETKANFEKMRTSHPRMDDETCWQWETRIEKLIMRERDKTMMVESQDKFKKYRRRTLPAKKKGVCVNIDPNEFPKSPSQFARTSRAANFNEIPVGPGTPDPHAAITEPWNRQNTNGTKKKKKNLSVQIQELIDPICTSGLKIDLIPIKSMPRVDEYPGNSAPITGRSIRKSGAISPPKMHLSINERSPKKRRDPEITDLLADNLGEQLYMESRDKSPTRINKIAHLHLPDGSDLGKHSPSKFTNQDVYKYKQKQEVKMRNTAGHHHVTRHKKSNCLSIKINRRKYG